MKARKEDSSFFDKVYEVTRLIPFGRVTTYGAIAKYLGKPGAARIVGWAMNKAGSCDVPVPAHRIVNQKGYLSGRSYFGTADTMEQLLRNEGVDIHNHVVSNMNELFWDPSTELD